jgi:hypothetical protein
MEVSGQLHSPAALFPGKQPPVPIRQQAGWVPETLRTLWRSENPLSLPGFKRLPLDRPALAYWVLVHNELEGMWKEAVVDSFKILPCIVLILVAVAWSWPLTSI